MVDLLLLPSPLLGPASWAPVARLLGAPVADPAGATRPEQVLAAYERAAEGLDDLVLVPHSNAGLYAPLLAERLGAVATVYVDAALPGSGDSGDSVALAPPAFLEFVSGLVRDDRLLPPWTRWWDAADVDGLFPDAATRAAVEAEQPRLPLTYFTPRLPVPSGWAERPSAYLAFGDTYADEIAAATGRGWPVAAIPGRHLHQLVAPGEVAATIAALVERAAGGR
ncbi:hypothetical protein KM427_04040 [Nocardioides sp. LMS-CY]|uniref:hypothetical protein n=1 Tax=Nocardioides sp. (strain LMS-CY) TaxID=2840457 RepID=UPI001C0004C4|nr:hypothetical protein [Nocardioides sp. LMS-CY]QWF22918.1 hypothetical protein KM427_04040 [Nocardioides sp. LMS-CY]